MYFVISDESPLLQLLLLLLQLLQSLQLVYVPEEAKYQRKKSLTVGITGLKKKNYGTSKLHRVAVEGSPGPPGSPRTPVWSTAPT